ncbi:MAG: gamma-glutamyltransferase family protein [Synergistaceae bacterium]|jgi:gamma-glutamyltranspeptidase/glutathione hydrolase|nr:gamma-glutamyltransferase family protein [Synergistaceae bacterium]
MSLSFDAQRYMYPSRRTVVYGSRGMVATGQPLAAQAGLEILKKGGNAVDAAVATAACLTVVEPTANGIGGDSFSLVWIKDKLYGLNASGFSPKATNLETLKAAGMKEMPKYGWYPVTVPGAPSGWAALSKKFGRLPLTEVLKPAIAYAADGYPVSPTVSKLWKKAFVNYTKEGKGDEFKHWFETFCPNGRAPEAGEIWSSKGHAETLTLIAETGAEAFYRGALAEKIDAFSKKYGAWLAASDLAEYYPEWVEPISVNYRGYDVWEIPPNGHGITALMALNILKAYDFSGPRENEKTYHLMIEAMKLAFVDTMHHVADPRFMKYTAKELLSQAYADERRKLIGSFAIDPVPGTPPKGGTVYLAAADGEGNMISMIQSNYMGFGSGLVVPGAGFALHNRGNNFKLDPESPNVLASSKKPYHTIIPGFLSKDGKAVGPFGVMGGFMQPQGHVQVVTNMVDFGMNPQEAIDAPRWQWTKGKNVQVEQGLPNALALSLAERGHDIQMLPDSITFGRGEIIVRTPYGTLAGGTEPRTDGSVAVW